MPKVTQMIEAAQRGEMQAVQDLLPIVYGELRKLATIRLANEGAGQTLQPTALVHEVYLRLLGNCDGHHLFSPTNGTSLQPRLSLCGGS
jgi:hypothetical protein